VIQDGSEPVGQVFVLRQRAALPSMESSAETGLFSAMLLPAGIVDLQFREREMKSSCAVRVFVAVARTYRPAMPSSFAPPVVNGLSTGS